MDNLLGMLYIPQAQFAARARMFGASARAMSGVSVDEQTAVIAMASRAIDNYLGRDFTPAAVTEQHAWDSVSRRVRPNRPPVAQLISFGIRATPGQLSIMPVNQCYVNNQAGYIELDALSLATGIQETILALGMLSPIAEISYKSYQSLPPALIAATGFAAASIINNSFSTGLIAPGIKSIESGDQSITAKSNIDLDPNFVLPKAALTYLSTLTQIWVG